MRQWIHSLPLSWVLLNVLTLLLRDGGTSDPEVEFVLLSWRLVVWRSVHSRCSEVLARGNLETTFMSLLASGSHLFAVRAFTQKSFFGLDDSLL